MDPMTEKANVDTITHSEAMEDSRSNDSLGIDHVIGRDFTVAEGDLPKGYVRPIFHMVFLRSG
jgi:hypothetical protein